MVAYAKLHVDSAGVAFDLGDAQALPIDSARFDVVVSGLVLNFVPEPQRAVAEMARVVRPGGTVAAYVWDYAEKMDLMRYFWDAAVVLDPIVLEFDEGPRFPICQPSPLAELFKNAGLQQVEVRPIDIPTHFRDFDDYWSPFLGGQGPAPGYAMSLSEERRGVLRERTFEPSNCQEWIDIFNGSGVGRSWTRAMTLSARSRTLHWDSSTGSSLLSQIHPQGSLESSEVDNSNIQIACSARNFRVLGMRIMMEANQNDC